MACGVCVNIGSRLWADSDYLFCRSHAFSPSQTLGAVPAITKLKLWVQVSPFIISPLAFLSSLGNSDVDSWTFPGSSHYFNSENLCVCLEVLGGSLTTFHVQLHRKACNRKPVR